MSALVVCLGCWVGGAALVSVFMFSLRMRKLMREVRGPAPWWATLMLFGIAAAWPLLVIVAIAEPWLNREHRARR